MAQDIDFSRMLDELDEPEATGFGTPVAEPSQQARDAFDLPGSTRKIIDDVVASRQRDAVQNWYVEQGKAAVSALSDPQQYKEFAKGIGPGAISMGGTAIQAPDAITAKGQQGAAKFGRKQLEIMDRIDRGEAVPEMEDPIGYTYMSQEQRQAARAEQQQATAEFKPTPMAERPFFKAGEKVQKFAKDLLPAAPGYEESVGRQLGEGMGSMAFGLPLAYFGGPVVAGTAFGSAGIGEATQRAVDYDRKEKAAGRPGLTEDQIATAGILGVGPGATDMLPVEVLIGRLPIPLPPVLRRPLAMAIGRIGGQAFIEGAQEGGQAFLQNLIAREVYNPSQPLVDGIGHEMGIGAGVGGIAETAKELGVWMLKSGAIRKKKGVHDSLVEHEKEKNEAAEAAPAPEDTRTLAPSQEGETPRLKKGEGSVRGPSPEASPAIDDANRLLAEIGEGTIAQAKGEPESGSGAPAAPVPPGSDSGQTGGQPVTQPVAPVGEQAVTEPAEVPAESVAIPETVADNVATPPVSEQAPPATAGTPPVAPATEAPAAVSTEAAITPATETVASPAAPTETYLQDRETVDSAPEIDDAARSRFSEVLSSKARRSDWGKASGLSEEQVQALTAEAVADGRLVMRKGAPVRTAKARQAPATPEAELSRAASSVPMGRAAEKRLEGVKSDVAYKHAAAILAAGSNRDAAIKKLSGDKKATRAVLDEIHQAVTGKPSKSLKTKQAVIDALAKAEVAPDLRSQDVASSEGEIISQPGKNPPADYDAMALDDLARLAQERGVFPSKKTKAGFARALKARDVQDQIDLSREARGRTIAVALGPVADSYTRRSLNSITDPVAREYYRNLIDAGTNVEPVIQAMAKDRRLSFVEQDAIAQAYVGSDLFDIDPFDAIRNAAAERGRELTLSVLGGFSHEISPSNLRLRDSFDNAILTQRLEELAERLPRGVALALSEALRLEMDGKIRALEGGVTTPRRALAEFGIRVDPSLKKVLAVSLEYGPDVALRTFTHEEIHLLREVKDIKGNPILTGKDWEILEGIEKRRPKKAEAERILETMFSEGKLSPAEYELLKLKAGSLTYRQLYDVDAKYGDYVVDDERGTRAEKLVEEAVAWAAGDWARGRSFASPIERVFQKIRDFLEAIQNAMHGLGFRSANDIFESIWSGELTRKFEEARERRFNAEADMLDWMGQEGITAMAIGPQRTDANFDEVFKNLTELDPRGLESSQELEEIRGYASELITTAKQISFRKQSEIASIKRKYGDRADFAGAVRQARSFESLMSQLSHWNVYRRLGDIVRRAEEIRKEYADYYRSIRQSEALEAGEIEREIAVEKASGTISLASIRELNEMRADTEGLFFSLPSVRERFAALRQRHEALGAELAEFSEGDKATFDQMSAIDSGLKAGGELGADALELARAEGFLREKQEHVRELERAIGILELYREDGNGPPIMAAFAGEKAKTADQEALAAAKRMESEGKTREAIWHETGWFKGVDGRWRFEIDDSKSKLRAFGPDLSLLHAELMHDPLFDAYPELTEVEFNRVAGAGGSFQAGGIIPSSMEVGKDNKSRKSVTLHETQHAIQDIETLARGGNTRQFTRWEVRDEAERLEAEHFSANPHARSWMAPSPEGIRYGLYRRLAGEVEARTVEARMNLTADQREERPPWLDYDVPEDQQIVRMPVEGEQRSMASVDRTDSDAFRAWFGDSKAADAAGKPLVMYHGTARGGFDAFDTYGSNYGLMGQGGYFTDNPEVASGYTNKGARKLERQGRDPAPAIYPVYLSIKNPMDMEALADIAAWERVSGEYGADFSEGMTNEQAYRELENALQDEQMPSYEGAEIMQDAVRSMGHDGITHIGGGRVDADGVRHRVFIAFDPAQIKSVNNQGTFDPNSDQMMLALRDWMPRRGQTPPQSTPDGESPGLNKIISDLRKTMGMTVSQGLWGFSVQQGNRSARVRPPSSVKGQFDRETGNVSLRQSRDIKTLAHEGGHYLESILGTGLGAVKQAHAEALTGDPAPMPAALSEGFANWFRDYILDPDSAEARAPGMTEAFEELLEAERPDMLEGFDTIQQEYQRYIKSAPIGEVAAGLSSQYDGTTWRELSKDKAFDNISGKLTSFYQGAIDGGHVAKRGVAYLLKLADFNGIRDEDGRPVSLPVHDNFAKRWRLFAGSFNRGRVWLDKGVSDLTTGRIIGPSLKSGLDKALDGGHWNEKVYKDFNQYLVSIRAIEEYNRLDQKKNTVKRYDDTLAKLAEARPVLAERLQKDAATLDRRQDALTRANAMLADRQRMLGVAETRLENIQERLDGVLADIAEAGEMGALAQDIADPLAENAVSENYGAMVARRRRQVQNLERQQREAVRAVERLSEEVSGRDVEVGMLQEEIRQLSEGVARGRQQVAQLDDMVARVRKERENASNRGASRPPTAEPRAVHERVIKELGTPEFQEAAKLVHDFTFSLLEARRQAGFITQEMFDELAKRRDWYVPFWRDMSDIEGAGAMFPGSGVKKWSIFKKFDGSDRSILMPLEILSEEAYSTAQQIAFNDMVKAMVGLAERVGPGGGKVAERLARSETMEANAETFDKIRKMATDLGVDEIDAHMITQRMEMNFSDGDIRVILSPENLGPTAKPQLPMWENGERVMVRLPDPEFGRDLFNAINGLGKEMSDILVKALALPAQMLRVGVTSHPDFMFRNMWRDIWTAWKLTGAAPFITQARGFNILREGGTVDGMAGEDFLRLYNEAGGIAGGINVNAQIADQRRDVKALLDTNIDKKAVAGGAALGGFTGLAAGSSLGSLMGLVFGGPVGAAVGFKVGATVGGLVGGVGIGYAARHGEVWRAVESVETATRLGVAAHAYKRAKEHNPDLSDTEAILEAAFVSRDIMDWNRRGSKMLAATRLVTFLNAQIQGLDKQLRQMTAQGDRGSALRKHLAIVFKHQSNDILSKDEQRDLADAYKSYVRWGAITLMLMGLAALYWDDDDYQDIKDETKATHSWFKALGIWFRLPKPFELALPANIGEIMWDYVSGRDQRMASRIVDSMYEVLAPPGMPQAMRLTGGLLFNRDRQGIFSGRSREIVGENLASRPPHERYHAFTSEFAIDLSRAMYNAGVPQSLIPAPVKTDFVLSAAGAYWGREVQNSYQTAKTMVGMSTRPDRKATDFPILRGFTGEAARMSRGVNDMWTMISREGGEFTMAATEYKQLMDDRGRPVEAEMWLKSLDPEQRVWALTQYYGSRSDKREHPLERASQADRINREIMRDTISDTLAPKVRQGRKTVRDYDEKIELSPAKKTEVIDILARLSQVEARNTMILMKRKGFEGMDIKDPQSIIDELKAASHPVHDLLLERRDKKVADWPDVVKEWPKYRERVLKESVGAF